LEIFHSMNDFHGSQDNEAFLSGGFNV